VGILPALIMQLKCRLAYLIRSDKNPQLKAGGVLAFGLVRGLTQIELGWNSHSTDVV